MRKSLFVLLPALMMSTVKVGAQDITEARNLSNLNSQATARSIGFGNALGSVGGDFSSISVNPAGLGIYRSSELVFTSALRINSANTDYAGTNTMDNNTRFTINNFGVVFTDAPKGKRYDRRSWKTVSFAFGMNRVADFNHDYSYAGKNTTSSASQAFESDANLYPGADQDPGALGYLGYQAYLTNKDSNGVFLTVVPFSGGINQIKNVHQTGGISEYVFSLAGNYKEKLMLGITIGIPTVRFDRNSYYTENVAAGNNSNPDHFNTFTYGQHLNITGNGINAKIGAIYKFTDLFRLGVAFHSPTYYSITDVSDPAITSVSQGQATSLTTGDYLLQNQFDYHFTTPWKGIVSATIMLNKFGFITADYEYVNYKSMRYTYPEGIDPSTNTTFQEEASAMNQTIKKTYTGASNFRLGGEARFAKYFMARLGFGYYGNAYTSYGQNTAYSSYTTERMDVSCGAGFHFKHFYADLGWVHSMYTGYEQPYSIDYTGVVSGVSVGIPVAKTTYAVNNVALTLGVKF
jgi:hypothetical protein